MGTKINYLKTAENDYQYFKFDYEHNHFGNPFCYCAQNICERYLKFVVDEYCDNEKAITVLKTHNLRKLISFIKQELPDFKCDWKSVMQADGFYFNARYPGEDYLEVTAEDCEECWEAVTSVRESVVNYSKSYSTQNNSLANSSTVTQAIKSF